jgi:prevent-host-death family protein
MKTISIRELHEKTGAWVRAASQRGRLLVSDRGRPVAVLAPWDNRPNTVFGKRKRVPGFAGLPRIGGNSSTTISEERDR